MLCGLHIFPIAVVRATTLAFPRIAPVLIREVQMIDVERHRWRAAIACEVAGLETASLRTLHADHKWRVGKMEVGGRRYSPLDIAELALFPPLRALGYSQGEAVAHAHDLRRDLRNVLVNRLHFGFWCLSAFEQADYTTGTMRVLYLDSVVERVITKLQLPLPTRVPFPKREAARLADAICDYVLSPSGLMRWQKWREASLADGKPIALKAAAVQLGAPLWFLQALLRVAPAMLWTETVYKHPRAPEVARHFEGIGLQ
jgi:hypothetical protein